MSAQKSPRNDFAQMAALFGRARARLGRSLAQLEECRAQFVAAQGERASLDDIASVLPGLNERMAKLSGEKVTRPAVERAFRIATDVRGSILDTRIMDDVAVEAEEGAGAAAELLAALRDLAAANDAMIAASEVLDDEIDEDLETGEESMAPTAGNNATGARPGGTLRMARTPISQVKGNTVTSQLMATLDRLDLPHNNGTLDLADDRDGRLTEQLVRALSDRFEVVDNTVRARQRPVGGFRTPSAAQSGRIAVDAQAIGFAADQLAVALDGIENQVRFVERPGLAGSAPRTRAMVDRRLAEIRMLSASPQGIPAGQANVKSFQLARETLEYLTAIGIHVDATPEDLCGDRAQPFDADAVTATQGAVVREELRSEVVEVGRLVNSIHTRLFRAAHFRSNAELGFRLERSLERAMLTALATLDKLGSVEMADTINLWESIDIEVPDSCGTYESLGNGLSDALRWLVDVSQPFVAGDREVAAYGNLAMIGLAGELDQIATVLEACARKLGEYEFDGTAYDIAENTSGLAVITRKCAEFANRLGS